MTNAPIASAEIQALLTFAVSLVATSRRVIARYRRRGFSTELKADASYVTEVDTAVERSLRTAIRRRFPGHGILGEEFASVNPEAAFRWILDPIDGTDNFAHGIPTFGTIIGLHHHGVPLVGVIDHPALKLTYSAGRGLGAFCNGKRIGVDDYAHIRGGHEIINTTAPDNLVKTGELYRLELIQRSFPNTRIYRDCFAHTRVFQGSAAAMVDMNLRLWDIAASQVLVEEAGGKFVCVREREAEGKIWFSVVFGRMSTVDTLLPFLAADHAGAVSASRYNRAASEAAPES